MKIIQSYVHRAGKCWLVSTIDRPSSSPYGPEWYYETLVWECSPEGHERGKLIGQGEDARGSIHEHLRIAKYLLATGEVPPPKEA